MSKNCIPVEALLLVGNMDPEVSMDMVSQSAKYVDRLVITLLL